MSVKVSILDPVYCHIPDKESERSLRPCLSHPAVFYRPGPYGRKVREEYSKSIIFSIKGLPGYYFYTGLLGKVRQYCRTHNLDLEIDGSVDRIEHQDPELPGIDIRPDQLDLIHAACRRQRGVIVAPPGYGKTSIIIAGIMYAFRQEQILFLCHTKDLVMQTFEELRHYGFKDVGIVGMGKFESHHSIIIATMQTVGKDENIKILRGSGERQGFRFSVVMVDEAHHVARFNGTYDKILKQLFAPVRLGFTATPPYEAESQLVLEGLIGPLIGEMTVEKGADLGLFAVPTIKLIKIPRRQKTWEIRKYAEAYDEGIVRNNLRNMRIVNIASGYWKEGKSTLVMVTKIDHGVRLQQAFEDAGYVVPFVRGHTGERDRHEIKVALSNKDIPCVIATVVWKEGVNIPSLDVVINAAGGKSEIATLQAIGRGLRKTKHKDQVIIVDFFDSTHRYLIAHFGERISLYMDNGWM